MKTVTLITALLLAALPAPVEASHRGWRPLQRAHNAAVQFRANRPRILHRHAGHDHAAANDHADYITPQAAADVAPPPAPSAKPYAPAPQAAPAAPVAPQASGYPLRSRWYTGCSNWKHMTTAEHAGKFDAAWLQSLSWGELQSLHSDHHDELRGFGRVHWDRVVRAVSKAPAAKAPVQSNCPDGMSCPTNGSRPVRRGFGIFGWR